MHQGIVQRFRKNHHEDVDGFILEDGCHVHFPPHLADNVLRSITLGDHVTIRGKSTRQFGGIVIMEAEQISSPTVTIDVASGESKIASPHSPAQDESSDHSNRTGQIIQFHQNSHGDFDGLFLADGTEVKWKPHLGEALQSQLAIGDRIQVEGHLHETPRGDHHFHADRITLPSGQVLECRDQHNAAPKPLIPKPISAVVQPTEPSNADLMRELKAIRNLLERIQV